MGGLPVDYPQHRVVDVVLRDGATVRIRPALREDRERLEDYLIGLSDESRYLRFGGPAVDVSEIAERATDLDYKDHLTLLAIADGGSVASCGASSATCWRRSPSFSARSEQRLRRSLS